MSSNSVCNHTRDKQIELLLRGRPILLSLVWLQTELDSTQSYYHYLSKPTSLLPAEAKGPIRDKQIGLPLRGRPILLSLVWLRTELDDTGEVLKNYNFREKNSQVMKERENLHWKTDKGDVNILRLPLLLLVIRL